MWGGYYIREEELVPVQKKEKLVEKPAVNAFFAFAVTKASGEMWRKPNGL